MLKCTRYAQKLKPKIFTSHLTPFKSTTIPSSNSLQQLYNLTQQQYRRPYTQPCRFNQTINNSNHTHQSNQFTQQQPSSSQHQQFSFEKHNIRVEPQEVHPLLSSQHLSQTNHLKSMTSSTKSKPSTTSSTKTVPLLSQELRQSNFIIEDPEDVLLMTKSTQSRLKQDIFSKENNNHHEQPFQFPSAQAEYEARMPLFLDATQPFLTASPHTDFRAQFKTLSYFILFFSTVLSYSIYNIWFDEEVYLASPMKLNEFIEKNQLQNVWTESTEDKLSQIYKCTLNMAAVSIDDYHNVQLLMNKHLMIGLHLFNAAEATQIAFKRYRDTIIQQIAAIDERFIPIEKKVDQNRFEEMFLKLYDQYQMPLFKALYQLTHEIQSFIDIDKQLTQDAKNIKGKGDENDKNDKNEQNNQNKDENNNTSNPDLIPPPEIRKLQLQLEEIDQYIVMIDVASTSLKEDLCEMFESFTCPTFVVLSSKQSPELIQSAVLSYSTINSTRLILQLLNLWLLYQQTLKVFPQLKPFDEMMKLWVQTKPYEYPIIGRLIHEEEEYKMEQLLAPIQRAQLKSNPELEEKFKLLMGQKENELLIDNNDNDSNDMKNTPLHQPSQTIPDEKDLSDNILEQLVRLPGILMAQPPPRYNLPSFIHAEHIIKYVTSIFSTPTLISKDNLDPFGNNNDDMNNNNNSANQRDQLMKKFASAPTLKAIINSLTLNEEQMKLLFTPPNENDIIDLSQFPKNDIFTQKTIQFDPTLGLPSLNNDDNTSSDNDTTNNIDPDQHFEDFTKSVLIGFINQVQEKGLPINDQMARTTLFDIVPFLHTNVYEEIHPLPRVDINSSEISRLGPIYALQQSYIENNKEREERLNQREEQRKLKQQEKQQKQQQQQRQPRLSSTTKLQKDETIIMSNSGIRNKEQAQQQQIQQQQQQQQTIEPVKLDWSLLQQSRRDDNQQSIQQPPSIPQSTTEQQSESRSKQPKLSTLPSTSSIPKFIPSDNSNIYFDPKDMNDNDEERDFALLPRSIHHDLSSYLTSPIEYDETDEKPIDPYAIPYYPTPDITDEDLLPYQQQKPVEPKVTKKKKRKTKRNKKQKQDVNTNQIDNVDSNDDDSQDD